MYFHVCVSHVNADKEIVCAYIMGCTLFLPPCYSQKLSLVVETDGSHSLEENMRQTLLACYTEFTDILRQMAVTHVNASYVYI